MDRISRRSQATEGVRYGGLWIPSLLFTDDTVLLVSSNSDLQLSLGGCAAEGSDADAEVICCVKREPSQRAKPSIYRSIYVTTLTYGYELWVVIKRMRL